MKILISTGYYLPNVSGITTYIQTLAEELVRKGHKVTILTSHHDLKSKREEVVNGVTIKRLRVAFMVGKGAIVPSFSIESIKELSKNDVMNCHLPLLESFWVVLINLFLKKKLIVTYHCSFDSGNKIINKLIALNHSFILKMASVIIVNSKDYINGYDLLKKYRKKIVEIYPPVVMNKSTIKEKDEVKNKLNKIKDKKVIGFLGRVSKEKNLELLLKAISMIDNNKIDPILIIAGPKEVLGENNYQIKIENILNKMKKNVIRLGEIENINLFLKKCDCIVIPSNNKLESFGLVQLEAIKNGVPCIAANLPGIRVVIKKSKMGELFEVDNEKDLSEKIMKVLLKGKNFYKKRVLNMKDFNYKKSVDEYERLFQNT